MKKNILFPLMLVAGVTTSAQLYAQEQKPKKERTQEIIIRKNGDKEEKMTIEVNGDSITVNGKPLSEYHDGDVTVVQNDLLEHGSNNFLFTPKSSMNYKKLYLNSDDAKPHTFLGVVTDKANDGVTITEVVKSSVAEKAGLLKGDVINKIDDKKIEAPEDLMQTIRNHKPGDEIKVYYERDSKKKDAKIKLGETKENNRNFIYKNSSPDAYGNNFNFNTAPMPKIEGLPHNSYQFRSNDRPRLGLKIEDTDNNTGAKVLGVEENSLADKAGLKKDDIITEVNGEKVTSVDDATDDLGDADEGSTINIKAMRNTSEMKFEIKIPKKLNHADL